MQQSGSENFPEKQMRHEWLVIKMLFRHSYIRYHSNITMRSRDRIPFSILIISINVLLNPFLQIVDAKESSGRFLKVTEQMLGNLNTFQRNYGVAVSDVDNDGELDFIVAGFSGRNFVLKYNTTTSQLDNIAQPGTPFENLMDVKGQAIGVCACDIDGDGREEIYFLNTNQAYAGVSSYGDKLFKWSDNQYIDLYEDPVNRNMSVQNYAGRSVACIDRNGDGTYGIAVATYSQNGQGNFAFVEVDSKRKNTQNDGIPLRDIAKEIGIDISTGGRAIAVGPIVGQDGKSDIFFGNEGNRHLGNSGKNCLFKNIGNGSFADIATISGVSDVTEAVRGIALADLNRDKQLDIVYGNWIGSHRIYIQTTTGGDINFKNIAEGDYEKQSAIRTVLATDFNNDGITEIFMNNIKSYNTPQPNKLFDVILDRLDKNSIDIKSIDVGDAEEAQGFGTGGAYTDVDNDGILELLLSHGESNAQPLEIYKAKDTENNRWIRVRPYTKFGAPARGATVTLKSTEGEEHLQVIDGGSGYLCQMEPVAHFGLGTTIEPLMITVQWQDGETVKLKQLDHSSINKVHHVKHPFHKPSSHIKIVNATFTTEVKHEEL
ncbi:unnamed protein product [Owenia fusiformis]|uniref:ASPIC/UnbV domain-containing protein n=1 Tax=Owenia fusiformis TaxID=6347 RepID=A0A8S4N3Z6_OWEFU|nr:unnamed protein product [Owenia fusiformis]